jgi:RNA polymerase sigma-70 factor, ECF subfamily
VVQDTFIRCWGGAIQYDATRGRLSSWLLGVARNRAIDVLRGRQHQARLHERASLTADAALDHRSGHTSDHPGARRPAPSYQAADDAVLLRHTVSHALAGLPLAQRQALVLAYFGGLTQAEIARALGIPLGTVKTRTRNGLERLRLALAPSPESADAPDGRW